MLFPCQATSRTVPAVPVAQIWGQTRCPVYRSGTFNVKRSTLNLQRGDRKGAWWPGYGDRHVIWATGLLNPLDPTKALAGRSQRSLSPRYGDRHDVRYTDQERSTSNVQLSTFNGVTERGLVGGIWGQTRNLGDRTLDPVDLSKRGSGARGGLGAQIWGQTRNLEDRTFDPADLSKRRSGGPSRLWCPDMGTDTVSDIPVRNVQRETFNSQLLTG